MFTFEAGSIDEPPYASRPVTQAWTTPLSIPSTVDSTTQDGISDITREDYDHVEGSSSYLSACSSVFTFEEGSIDKLPDASLPVTQVWAPPLSIASKMDRTTQDSISDVTREDYDHVASDNTCLSCIVQELHQQMAHLLLQQQHNKPNPESTSHHPNNNLSQVFIAQVTEAVAQIQKEKQMIRNQYHRIPQLWGSHGRELPLNHNEIMSGFEHDEFHIFMIPL